MEPYKPDAVDADHDGVVQEDTAFERPAGTRLLNSLGQAIVSGMTSADALDGLRFVDADGNDVAYTPRWVGKIDAGPDTAGLTDIRDSGAKIVGEFSASLKDRGLMIGDAIKNRREIEKKRAAAKPGTFGNPVMARDVDHAIELINQGHFVELKKPEDIVTLTERLVELNDEAIKKGVDMPSYGLCYASVQGTNLFCAEQFKNSHLGFIRAEMPQVGGKPREGSKAHQKALRIEKETGKLPEEVTAGDEWMESLAGRLIGHEETTRVASHMHASQNELVAKKVANFTKAGLLRNEAIRRAQAGDPMLDPRETDFVDGVKVDNPHFGKPITLEMAEAMWHPGKDPIYVSRDGYVIDGHHRWAAVVNVDAADGTLGQDSMPVVVIDLSIHEALADARAFTADFGILAKSAKANDLAPDDAPDAPDAPDVPDVDPLQGTMAGDLVHHRGSQRDKREVIDPVAALVDSVLITPKRRNPDDEVHIITDTHSSKKLRGEFSPYGRVRNPSRPKLNGRRFNENLRNDTREDGYGGLPSSITWDRRHLETYATLGLSRDRSRDATPEEIAVDAHAERAGRARVHHVFDSREGGPPQVPLPWDGTLEDIVDPTQLDQLEHDWGSWQEKGYDSQREYIDAVFEFLHAEDEFMEAERAGFPDVVARKEIRISKTVDGVERTPQQRQLTLVHEIMHHFDYGYDPNGTSHMVSEFGEIVSHPLDAVPGSTASEISSVGREEVEDLVQAAINSPSMQKALSEEGISTKHQRYVFDPLEIFARAASQWLMAKHGNNGQRAAALEMAEESLGMEDREWNGTVSFTEAEMVILGPLVERVLTAWNALK